MKLFLITLALVLSINAAEARPRDCYGIAWCGCQLRHEFGIRDTKFNLARYWVNFGRPIRYPVAGAIGVELHHVFRVIRVLTGGRVYAHSGNDGGAVRDRVRSTGRVIAWRLP